MKKKSNAAEIYGKMLKITKSLNAIEEIINYALQKSDLLAFDSEELDIADKFIEQLGTRQNELLAELRPLQKAYYGI